MSLDKLRKLKSVQSSILKDYGEQEFISTGCGTLNILFGGGIDRGIPVGKVSMIAADSSLGKSFVGLKVAKNAQDKRKSVIMFDSEKAYSPVMANSLGINANDILVIQNTSVEEVSTQFMNICEEIKENISDYVFIIDSWNVLVTSKSIDDISSGKDVADFTSAKKKNTLSKLLLHSGATVFIINQIYSCVSPKTKVKTPDGCKFMEELKVGDEVITTNGVETIQNKFEYNDVLTYKITLENGDTITCSGFHKFIDNSTNKWKMVEELKIGDELKIL